LFSLPIFDIMGRVMKMDKEKELPKRKHPRLDNYDYSSAGAYFVTICTQNRRCVLSRIVGRGLAPAEITGVEYTPFGEIAEKQLFLLKDRYPYLAVDKYVIMPNHIHVIMILSGSAAGASPRPTIADIVCAYKSLTTRECKKNGFEGILFQTSFYEHIIRGREDYEKIVKYIYENPLRWYYDELYAEE
jgi:REP element-mobilizing transposase RayT